MNIQKQKHTFFIILISISLFTPLYLAAQATLDDAITALTDQINKYMLEQKKTKIAIIPFPDLQQQTVTVLGSFIAEELTTNLFATGKFKIIERSLLKQILDELKLSQTGIVDAASAKELGKMTGVDAIIAGTLADLGDTIAMNCRLIETQSGEVFAAAKSKFTKDKNIENLLGASINENILSKKEKLDEGKLKESKMETYTLPFTLDASKYKIKYAGAFYGGSQLHIELISFVLYKNTIVKLNFKSETDYYWHRFRSPSMSDEKGNQYLAQKVESIYVKKEDDNYVIEKVPSNLNILIVCEFPIVPNNTKKLFINIFDKQIEIDWQELLKNRI